MSKHSLRTPSLEISNVSVNLLSLTTVVARTFHEHHYVARVERPIAIAGDGQLHGSECLSDGQRCDRGVVRRDSRCVRLHFRIEGLRSGEGAAVVTQERCKLRDDDQIVCHDDAMGDK